MNYRKETELGPDAIQKWCEELDSKPKMEMSQEESDVFIRCTAYESDIRHNPECQKMLKGWNAAAILNERVKSSYRRSGNPAVLDYQENGIDPTFFSVTASPIEMPDMLLEEKDFPIDK